VEEIMTWKGFYLAFLFYKNCVIVHGVKQRATLGVASSFVANKVASLLPSMVLMTKQILQQEPPPRRRRRSSSSSSSSSRCRHDVASLEDEKHGNRVDAWMPTKMNYSKL
jgi:hypothetical protein